MTVMVPASLEEAQVQVHTRLHDVRGRLLTWKIVYYVIGLTSVAAAAVAGFTGLADLVSVQVAGAIALGSAVLGAADKFLGAGGQVERLATQCGSLKDEDMWLDITIKSGQDQQAEIAGLRAEIEKQTAPHETEVLKKDLHGKVAAYEKWQARELAAVQDYISKHPAA